MPVSITRETDGILIFIPNEDVLSGRIMLQPCPCKAPKSAKTANMRSAFEKAISKATYLKPHDDPITLDWRM